MNIKIKCGCGSPLEFDEQPVNGKMSSPIACPSCGKDCTAQANEVIAKTLKTEQSLPSGRSGSGLSLRMDTSEPSLLSGATRASSQPPGALLAREFEGEPKPENAELVVPPASRLLPALLAAVLVGAAGAFGWYWLAIKTGFYYGVVASLIGVLTGFTCRLLAPSGGFWLATIASLAAGGGILGGHLLVYQSQFDKTANAIISQAYNSALDSAKSGLKLTNSLEIQDYLTTHSPRLFETTNSLAQKGAPPHPVPGLSTTERMAFERSYRSLRMTMTGMGMDAAIDAESKQLELEEITKAEVAAFREKEQPALRDLVAGKPSAAEWKAKVGAAVRRQFPWDHYVIGCFEAYTVLWTVLGMVAAYKLAYNQADSAEV